MDQLVPLEIHSAFPSRRALYYNSARFLSFAPFRSLLSSTRLTDLRENSGIDDSPNLVDRSVE